jgi:hypothetical protein
MSNIFSDPTSKTLADNLQQIRPRLAKLDCDGIARQVGFLIRKTRKIPILDLLLALIAISPENKICLERIASVIALVAGCNYSKQAFQKRLSASLESFLAHIAAVLMVDLSAGVRARGLFAPFKRVIVHDSTCERVPDHLAKLFPGSKNQRKNKPQAILKIQLAVDLLNSKLISVCLAGYTRNDQAAAQDILPLLEPEDLVLRDLGYFTIPVLEKIQLKGAFFLSRFRHGVGIFTLEGKPLNLARELQKRQAMDQEVLLGAQKMRVRLVAQPVPPSVGNERRRKAKASRDHRCTPSREHLILMDWNIFLTNVSPAHWPAKVLFPLYRLRWRIEMIFKTWKSHLGLRQFNTNNAALLRLSVMLKLLYCLLMVRLCDELEMLLGPGRHVSLLRLARIMSQCACLVAAQILRLTPIQWLQYQLENHLFYEARKDRKNYFELLDEVMSLG